MFSYDSVNCNLTLIQRVHEKKIDAQLSREKKIEMKKIYICPLLALKWPFIDWENICFNLQLTNKSKELREVIMTFQVPLVISSAIFRPLLFRVVLKFFDCCLLDFGGENRASMRYEAFVEPC